VLLAFLVGAVAGAAVALLYAPATGREVREFLGDRPAKAASDQGRLRTGDRGGAGVSTWATVFLGIIAVTTLLTAITQIILLVAAAALVRRVTKLVDDFDREVRPILGTSAASPVTRRAWRLWPSRRSSAPISDCRRRREGRADAREPAVDDSEYLEGRQRADAGHPRRHVSAIAPSSAASRAAGRKTTKRSSSR